MKSALRLGRGGVPVAADARSVLLPADLLRDAYHGKRWLHVDRAALFLLLAAGRADLSASEKGWLRALGE